MILLLHLLFNVSILQHLICIVDIVNFFITDEDETDDSEEEDQEGEEKPKRKKKKLKEEEVSENHFINRKQESLFSPVMFVLVYF